MDPSSRPSPLGHSSVGTPTESKSIGDEGPPFTAPLVLRRHALSGGGGGGGASLREQHITAGQPENAKSSISLVSPQAKQLSDQDRLEQLSQALDGPLDPSKPVFDQAAHRGVLYRQLGEARGETRPTMSSWQQGLLEGSLLRPVHLAGLQLFGPPPALPPARSDAAAMEDQARASLDLDPSAPLPDREAMDQRWTQAAGSQAAIRRRFDRIGYHLEGLAALSDRPMDPDEPGRLTLGRLRALDQEIQRLLGDKSDPVPQRLRAELTLLGARVRTELVVAQAADAFARNHDTANLNFEGVTAYMRHGFTGDQLHFLLFVGSLSAAVRASFERGSPIPVPQAVTDSYQALWQQIGKSMREGSPAPGPTPPGKDDKGAS